MTHLVKCVFAETAGVSQALWLPVVRLYCINYTAGLWIIRRAAVLRITGQSFFFFFTSSVLAPREQKVRPKSAVGVFV